MQEKFKQEEAIVGFSPHVLGGKKEGVKRGQVKGNHKRDANFGEWGSSNRNSKVEKGG